MTRRRDKARAVAAVLSWLGVIAAAVLWDRPPR